MADISDSDIENSSNKSNDTDSDYYSDTDIEEEEDINDKNEETSNQNVSNSLPEVNITPSNNIIIDSSSDEEDDDSDIIDIQNIVESIKTKNQIKNNNEIKMLCKIKRNKQGKITDKFHTTLPVLSKYEKTRIIGQRAKQIENGSAPFIKVHTNVIDAMLIAEEELKQKKIPIIIKRPLPNGTNEYWPLKELELI